LIWFCIGCGVNFCNDRNRIANPELSGCGLQIRTSRKSTPAVENVFQNLSQYTGLQILSSLGADYKSSPAANLHQPWFCIGCGVNFCNDRNRIANPELSGCGLQIRTSRKSTPAVGKRLSKFKPIHRITNP